MHAKSGMDREIWGAGERVNGGAFSKFESVFSETS